MIMNDTNLRESYKSVRLQTEAICELLQIEDYVVQPAGDVSPPKWHIGHTTWFFETFLLKPYANNYKDYNPDYNYVFNSYYETVGARVIRTDRGNLSRPTVKDVYQYRKYVDVAMEDFLGGSIDEEVRSLVILGLNHEQQHQELLYTDIKYILGHNPLFPAYAHDTIETVTEDLTSEYVSIPGGVYEIGFDGKGFCFDNELGRHKVYVNDYDIRTSLVTNSEYLGFINAGGYSDFRYWHAEGWEWVKNNKATSPLYWHLVNGQWSQYTMQGLIPLAEQQPLCHINYYEATAFAAWKGLRLPTEAEWEIASSRFNWGTRWEWTESAYLPYPGFTKTGGAIGEYNGKFMVSQMVLRGASVATALNHSRPSYRNFFHPHLQWQFTGIRLAK
jgi:ergothioneine biosynthesis protein EgtB